MKNIYFLFILLAFTPSMTQAGVYKQIDESGNVTYSNIRSNKAKQLDLPSITVVPGIDSATVEDKIKKRMESIKNEEQHDAVKSKITEETIRLEELKGEYKGGTPDRLGNERNYQRYLDRVEHLKSEITVREKNLEILNGELQQLPPLNN